MNMGASDQNERIAEAFESARIQIPEGGSVSGTIDNVGVRTREFPTSSRRERSISFLGFRIPWFPRRVLGLETVKQVYFCETAGRYKIDGEVARRGIDLGYDPTRTPTVQFQCQPSDLGFYDGVSFVATVLYGRLHISITGWGWKAGCKPTIVEEVPSIAHSEEELPVAAAG